VEIRQLAKLAMAGPEATAGRATVAMEARAATVPWGEVAMAEMVATVRLVGEETVVMVEWEPRVGVKAGTAVTDLREVATMAEMDQDGSSIKFLLLYL